MRLEVTAAVMLLLAASCAITDPPPGGPEDTKPPRIVETYPGPGTAGVPVDAAIEITFDEKMSGAKIQRLVTFYPEVPIKKASWKKNTVRLQLEAPLHPDTTYVVELKPGFADAHGVRSQEAFNFAFATSVAIDSGSVSGTVYFRRKPTDKALVRLFVLPRDSAFTPQAERPDRQVHTNKKGEYRFGYLPLDRRFVLWAFHDGDANNTFNPDGEAGATFPDTLLLFVPVTSNERNDIFIIDPKEPAKVAGRILNQTGIDSIPITMTLTSLTDTVPPTYLWRTDLEGNYAFDRALQGEYILQGFLDLGADSLCGTYPCGPDSASTCQEPCVTYPDTLRLEPGDSVDLEDLILGAAGEQGSSE